MAFKNTDNTKAQCTLNKRNSNENDSVMLLLPYHSGNDPNAQKHTVY